MNDIINWVALNNTLMIRIGFSAVVLLLVVYAFRFFFMPSMSVIPSDSSKDDAAKDSTSMSIEELAELQGEIDTLKAKLKELQSGGQKPAAPVAAAPSPGGAGLETVSAEPSIAAAAVAAEPSVSEGASKELKEKIKTLEARLSEYEIIAEEIAEIGKLRVENQKLKEMLATPAPEPVKVAAAEEEPEQEKIVSGSAVADSEIDALLGSVDENTAADALNPLAAEAEAEIAVGGVSVEDQDNISVSGSLEPEPEKELFILHSEVEVTEEEKELINSFEDFKKV